MIHIAVGEAGSFGAVVDGEQCFIIGAFEVKDIKPLRKLFRQTKRYALPKRLRHLAEVKASAAPDKFRERLYRGLSQLDVEVHLAIVELACSPQSKVPSIQGEGDTEGGFTFRDVEPTPDIASDRC